MINKPRQNSGARNLNVSEKFSQIKVKTINTFSITGTYSCFDGVLQLRPKWRRRRDLSGRQGTRAGDCSDKVDGWQDGRGIDAKSDRQSAKYIHVYQSISRTNALAGEGFLTGGDCQAIDRIGIAQRTGRRLGRQLQRTYRNYRRCRERLLQVSMTTIILYTYNNYNYINHIVIINVTHLELIIAINNSDCQL